MRILVLVGLLIGTANAKPTMKQAFNRVIKLLGTAPKNKLASCRLSRDEFEAVKNKAAETGEELIVAAMTAVDYGKGVYAVNTVVGVTTIIITYDKKTDLFSMIAAYTRTDSKVCSEVVNLSEEESKIPFKFDGGRKI